MRDSKGGSRGGDAADEEIEVGGLQTADGGKESDVFWSGLLNSQAVCHAPSFVLTSAQVLVIILHEAFYGYFQFPSVGHACGTKPAQGLQQGQVGNYAFGEHSLLYLS